MYKYLKQDTFGIISRVGRLRLCKYSTINNIILKIINTCKTNEKYAYIQRCGYKLQCGWILMQQQSIRGYLQRTVLRTRRSI